MIDFKEADLYAPVCEYFEALGYSVQGEVKDCDLVAVKENETIIAELKKSFCLKLVYQALERQNLTELVYIVIPRPKKGAKTTEWRNMLRLMKKLDIGIITVAIDSTLKTVDIVSVPSGHSKSKNSSKKAKLTKELNDRNINENIGGINKTKILTAYKEKCIHALCLAEKNGYVTSSMLKECLNDNYADRIPRSNYYGWFERESKGIYRISTKGNEILKGDEYSKVVEFYRNMVNQLK